MMRSLTTMSVVALSLALDLSSAASAQAAHRRLLHPAAEGRQIIVHPRETYLTLGPGASVGQYNGYALDTISSGASPFLPGVDHTTVGLRGQNCLPSNFTVPGCCAP